MSRIGNRILSIPDGVTVNIDKDLITVKGPKGELKFNYKNNCINVEVLDNTVVVKRNNEIKTTKQLHGTTNSIINNMIIGVTEGYKKDLEIVGVGYKFLVNGNKLTVNAGYSNPVVMDIPQGVKVESASQTELSLSGIDKQEVTEFAAVIREVRKPEPYKGKGIKYKDEYIRRKEGKKAA
ncbi:MAG: 50S ribosomal protein L6 [Bacilli bacterium]